MYRWSTMIYFSAILILFSSFRIDSARRQAEAYIDMYKAICIEEMQRTGIPASIKLAQGMLESDLGRSPLAVSANNHFGIKCGKDWLGGTFFKEDDDLDTDGNLIESCFRKFAEPEESFRAHSAFLMNPAKQKRYGVLFTYPSTDYVAWANGLKEAGYATDPAYPTKLIRIIEEYSLYNFDAPLPAKENVLTSQPLPSQEAINVSKKATPVKAKLDRQRYFVSLINGLRAVHAAGGESLTEIAENTQTDVYALLEFNEGYDSPEAKLATDDIVFLDRKKKVSQDAGQAFHIANGKESLFQISQKYGIRLQCLVDRNGIPEQCVPLKDSKISLLTNIPKSEVPDFRKL